MKPCLSEATTLTSTFAEDVDALADGGQTGMEVWLTKLEDHLKTNTAPVTRRFLEDKQVTLAAASYQGGLLLSQGEQRRAHYDHFRQRLEICQQLKIPTLLLVADFVERVDPDAGFSVPWSRSHKLLSGQLVSTFVWRSSSAPARLSARASIRASLASLLNAASSNVGVNLDLFHYYTGPSKFEDLELLDRNNLAFVQVADLAGVPRELATDADRVLPGDGDFRFGPILEQLRKIGYAGYVSVELLNPTIWSTKPAQVVELARMALARLLGPPGG